MICSFIQRAIDDYCYVDLCPCANGGVRVWSWFRQLVMLKLAMVVYRRHVIAKVAMGQSNRAAKNPIMESLVLVILAIGIDTIFVLWIRNN